jgi:hypothetical protein
MEILVESPNRSENRLYEKELLASVSDFIEQRNDEINLTDLVLIYED